jgi:hypothetical protein
MHPADRLLSLLMRLNAGILLLAAVPMFFPTRWMATMHETLGLGQFPEDRLTEYLTRSAAACYTMHGAVVWLIAQDVRRYRPLIPGLYVIHLLFAFTLLLIDLFAGMPAWWIVSEVGTISTVAILMLFVQRWAARQSPVLESDSAPRA